MNRHRRSWAAISLVAPLIILCTLLLASLPGRQNQSFAKNKSTPASLQAGLISTITGEPPLNFQNVFLNVQLVRLNPKPNAKNTASPGENDKKWVNITVPTGVGTGVSGKPGDLQIDLVAGQSKLQLFNTGGIRPDSYHTVELVVDVVTTGFIVPVCPSASGLEGCINYPIILQNPGNQISFVSTSGITTAKGVTTQLAIQVNMQIVQRPSQPGGPFVVNVTIAPAPSNAAQFVGNVSGSVQGPSGQSKKFVRDLAVTAELAGTNIAVASTRPTPVGNALNYSLNLPASLKPGTAYDLYVSGGEAQYQALKNVVLTGGQATPLPTFTPAANQVLGNISGKISDRCTGKPISGAVVQILAPPLGSSADCLATPQNCVSVATATTDNTGKYPMPGTNLAPAPFNNVPVGPSNVLEVSATGYDTLFSTASASSSRGNCPAGSDTRCDFSLTTAYINGVVNLVQPPGSGNSAVVQVYAEQTGTNNLVGALTTPVVIKGINQSGPFSLNIPTQSRNLDLFASAIDLFQGVTDPYPGHSIIAQPGIAVPAACATATPAGLFAEPMDCTGHGSLSGTASNPDSGTTVQLYKDAVALMQSAVGPVAPAPAPGNSYTFCAPPDDSYSAQRLEQGAADGPTVAVGPMATPAATSSPCPSTCLAAKGECPGTCGDTTGPNL